LSRKHCFRPHIDVQDNSAQIEYYVLYSFHIVGALWRNFSSFIRTPLNDYLANVNEASLTSLEFPPTNTLKSPGS
jgi:hypothetical protein